MTNLPFSLTKKTISWSLILYSFMTGEGIVRLLFRSESIKEKGGAKPNLGDGFNACIRL